MAECKCGAYETRKKQEPKQMTTPKNQNKTSGTKKIDQIIAEIANKHLHVETLQEQKSDRLDFHECHVLAIKEALEAAYQAGREATK